MGRSIGSKESSRDIGDETDKIKDSNKDELEDTPKETPPILKYIKTQVCIRIFSERNFSVQFLLFIKIMLINGSITYKKKNIIFLFATLNITIFFDISCLSVL